MAHEITRRSLMAVLSAAMIAAGLMTTAARADDQQGLIDKARVAVEGFATAPEMKGVPKLLRKAKGILVVPQLLKAAFFVGGAGGTGVLMVREGSEQWSQPAFYTMGAGSFGLQFGGETSEVVLLLMTDKAVKAVMKNKIKLGAELSAAVGPVGNELEAATTTNVGTDIYSYSRNKGLFIGASFEGAVIAPRKSWNELYYGRETTPEDIFANKVKSAGATALRAAVRRLEQK